MRVKPCQLGLVLSRTGALLGWPIVATLGARWAVAFAVAGVTGVAIATPLVVVARATTPRAAATPPLVATTAPVAATAGAISSLLLARALVGGLAHGGRAPCTTSSLETSGLHAQGGRGTQLWSVGCMQQNGMVYECIC